jgi:membrane-bound inhibitor of C-type lysozyme
MKKILLLASLVMLVGCARVASPKPAQPVNVAPGQTVFHGTYTCLPHRGAGPTNQSCALGLHADDGSYFVLDTHLMVSALPAAHDRITVEGSLTTMDQLSSDAWSQYDINGVIAVAKLSLADIVATFTCKDNKTIVATFHPGNDTSVELALSDGRSKTVPRAISASGARYADPGDTFVFWNKGNTAFITEGAQGTETFSECVTTLQ